MFDYKQKLNRVQSVLTASQFKQLVKNHNNPNHNLFPVVKFFDPCGAGTWLISELNPETGIGYGLADLGMDSPEIGSVDLNELLRLRPDSPLPGRLFIGIERDLHFHPDKGIEDYATEARSKGRIQV